MRVCLCVLFWVVYIIYGLIVFIGFYYYIRYVSFDNVVVFVIVE